MLARLPIGASDFALDAYSLDDTPGDLELRDFSMERDQIEEAINEVRAMLPPPSAGVAGT